MAEKMGPRVIVKVGKHAKTGKILYAQMLKKTAEYYGFVPEKRIPYTRSNRGKLVYSRGAIGSGSIKVPTGRLTPKKHKQYKSIPMPEGITIPSIVDFLKKATKQKPDHFVTEDGRTWPVSQ